VLTLADARLILAGLRPRLEGLIAIRANLAELRADLEREQNSSLGGLAEAKAWEARLFTDLEYLAGQGAEVKGYAPLLLDFPGEIDRVPVYWCWLEGDPDIDWYHRIDCGFAGRRRVHALD
jgi:hypothetical protein